MANFIISPYAISFESIKNNLMEYVKTKHTGDNNEKNAWTDFYASSAGQTEIEIAAALGAFYAFHFIMGRRESYMPVAQNYSSLVGLAQNNGYSCNRGTNLQVRINFIANQSAILPKWTKIGDYGEYDVILLEDTLLNYNIATSVPAVIGNLMEESLVINYDGLQQFSFVNADTTEHFRLLLNREEVPISTQIKDLVNDKYVTITNTYGAYDVFYLNQGEYKYVSGDTLTSQFVQRNSLIWSNYQPDDLTIDYASLVNEVTPIRDKQEVEDIEQIRVNAPIYHETSMVIRSRKDYAKYLKQVNPFLIAVNDRDVSPGLIELTYIRRDGLAMTENDKNYWLKKIEESRPSGVARAIISEPIEVPKSLDITVWRANNEYFSNSLSSDIDKLLSSYDLQFANAIDLNQIEHEIEQFQGVKIARVELASTTWTPETQYSYYDYIKTAYGNFYVSKFAYKSGDTEPDWPLEGTIRDNNLIWEKVNEVDNLVTNEWKPNTTYDRYDYIRKDITSTGEYGISGALEPGWRENGELLDRIYDKYVVWERLEEEPEETIEVQTWAASCVYHLDDIIKVVERILGEDIIQEHFYKCVECRQYISTNIYRVCNFTIYSGTEEPEWGDINVSDNNIVWKKMPTLSSIWTANTEFVLGDVIKTSYGYYTVYGFTNPKYKESALSGMLEPSWVNKRGVVNTIVYDNFLTWRKLTYNYLESWQPNYPYQLGDVVVIDENNTYTVSYFTCKSGLEEPDWSEISNGRVQDGEITWSYMSEELRTIDLDWNQYIRLTKDSTNFTLMG